MSYCKRQKGKIKQYYAGFAGKSIAQWALTKFIMVRDEEMLKKSS